MTQATVKNRKRQSRKKSTHSKGRGARSLQDARKKVVGHIDSLVDELKKTEKKVESVVKKLSRYDKQYAQTQLQNLREQAGKKLLGLKQEVEGRVKQVAADLERFQTEVRSDILSLRKRTEALLVDASKQLSAILERERQKRSGGKG